MTAKQRTFKQRIRRNDLRQRNDVSRDLKKRMRINNRKYNRYDESSQSGRSMEELVQTVQGGGGSVAARDVDLDPRSLANLLLTGNKDKIARTAKLPDTLPEAHPATLPDVAADNAGNLFAPQADNQGNNKNRYKHHGASYLFWERVGLHPLLVQALKSMKFTHPTPVQEEVLPSVLDFIPTTAQQQSAAAAKKRALGGNAKKIAPGFLKEDIVVAAETGSGKTLVFALPVLHHILLQMEADDEPLSYDVGTGKQPVGAPDVAEVEVPVDEAVVDDDVELIAKEKKKRRTEKVEPASDKKKKAGAKTRKGRSSTTADDNEEEANEVAAAAAVPASPLLPKRKPTQQRIMHTLIVSPTRELAMQIKAAMEQLTVHANGIRIGCVVGGMAQEKQQRVLNRMPHVLICTPGRLWDLLQHNEGCYLGHSISRRLRFVILDEADKLMQGGRFEELKKILDRIHCDVLPAGFGQRIRDIQGEETLVQDAEEGDDEGDSMEAGRWDEEKQKFIPFTKAEKEAAKNKKKGSKSSNEESGSSARVGKDRPRLMDIPPAPEDGHRVGTFITSATLSLQTNYTRKDYKSNKSIIRTTNASTMQAVLNELGIREKNSKVFNMSPEAGVVAKINETFLRCPDTSKDLYLYYFLRTYKERTIIFVNAISMLRRLTHILEVLGIPVVGLHASMQQRQRLKFIERFRTGEKRVLVATDIASRGIDIEGLRYVLHYQVPRSTDAYIHRCGRTARCGGTGLSVLMVSAAEYVSFKKLLQSLGRSENSMETFSLEPSVVHHLHPHMTIALQIDKLQREVGKTSAGARWVKRMSNETEIDADDMVDDANLKENAAKLKTIKQLKYRLDDLVRKHNGHFGGKGGFRTGSKALGGVEATQRMRERADRQVIKGAKF